ncbi:MAG TPA: sigma-70 family RNA polymerase sigma factor [Solirubrobacteraceae bacterium]|nr:sigma-70 family RNA polymerase sigma factor [Solirubrobacteraceae bacterium]
MDDDRLVEQVRAGSDEAFERIVRRYRGPLVGFAAKALGGSLADAEDVVQDALIRALHGLRATERPIALRPWLYMVVRNRAIDHARAPARRRSDGDERLALLPALDADPAERAVAREELHAVVGAIAALPPRQRLALAGRELGGASHAELADRLDTSVSAAKSLILRGREAVTAAVAA